jgi:hypothetical protein
VFAWPEAPHPSARRASENSLHVRKLSLHTPEPYLLAAKLSLHAAETGLLAATPYPAGAELQLVLHVEWLESLKCRSDQLKFKLKLQGRMVSLCTRTS